MPSTQEKRISGTIRKKNFTKKGKLGRVKNLRMLHIHMWMANSITRQAHSQGHRRGFRNRNGSRLQQGGPKRV